MTDQAERIDAGELAREEAERVRQERELLRQAAEETRVTAEANRMAAEAARDAAIESVQLTAESLQLLEVHRFDVLDGDGRAGSGPAGHALRSAIFEYHLVGSHHKGGSVVHSENSYEERLWC